MKDQGKTTNPSSVLVKTPWYRNAKVLICLAGIVLIILLTRGISSPTSLAENTEPSCSKPIHSSIETTYVQVGTTWYRPGGNRKNVHIDGEILDPDVTWAMRFVYDDGTEVVRVMNPCNRDVSRVENVRPAIWIEYRILEGQAAKSARFRFIIEPV